MFFFSPEQYYLHRRGLNLVSNGKRVGLMRIIFLCRDLHNRVHYALPLTCLWSTVISLLEVISTNNQSGFLLIWLQSQVKYEGKLISNQGSWRILPEISQWSLKTINAGVSAFTALLYSWAIVLFWHVFIRNTISHPFKAVVAFLLQKLKSASCLWTFGLQMPWN